MNLVWTEPAVADVEALRSLLDRDSPPLADRTVDRLFEAVERALPFPRLGRVVSEVGDEAVREMLVRTFRVIYQTDGRRLAVLSVLPGGRASERRENRRWES